MQQTSSYGVVYSDLTWVEVKDAISRDALIVIPTGSVEPHGFHLPLEVDSVTSRRISQMAALEATPRAEVFVTDPIWMGASYVTPAMPGALSLKRTTYITVLKELCECLIKSGFKRLCLLNGHGGNWELNQIVARDLSELYPVLVGVANYWELVRKRLLEVRTSSLGTMGHAGEMETSLMMALEPSKVRTEKRAIQIPNLDRRYYAVDMLDVGCAALYCSLPIAEGKRGEDKAETGKAPLEPKPGIWGDATLATPELGRRYLSIIVEEVAGYFIHLYEHRRELD